MLTIEFILKEIKNINFSFTGELQLKDNGDIWPQKWTLVIIIIIIITIIVVPEI